MRYGIKETSKVNSQWKEEAITINHHVSIGVALAVEDGLVVPVLKVYRCNEFISNWRKRQRSCWKSKKQKYYQPNGRKYFTVSNLGMFGIVEFNSINQPAISYQ
jgi:pyruvate dehydrogenase E2 component (dihydrolipoamide acetyltransferase)